VRPSDPRVREVLAPARHQLAGVGAAGLLAGALVIAQAWAVAGLVVAVVRGEDVVRWGMVAAAVLLARGAVSAVGDVLAARAASVVSTVLRHRLVAVPVDRGPAGSSGARSVLVTRGVSAIEPYVTRYLPALVLATILPALTVVAIATQDLLSAVIVLATLPLVPVFGALVGLATRDRAEQQWRAMGSLAGHFVDVVRGLPTLVAHRRARAQSRRIAEVTDRYRVASLGTLRIAFASSAVLELVATLSVALVAVTIGVRLAGGSIGLHTALVVLLLAPEAYWPLRRVGAEFHAAAEGTATLGAAHELLAVAPDHVDRAAPRGADLEIDDLSVTYAGRNAPALTLACARIPARGVTAVTGPSGCGKSTLLAAIAGLQPHTGSISAAGVSIGGPHWQSQVAWLAQQPLFFEGTVADNLRLARPAASADELWTALRQVALEVRVQELPDGLHAPVGEDGVTLSAGERARLALARVILADRPWVLLDEPTAHLDPLTERIIADTIVELGKRASVVVVAHRPWVVELADRQLELTGPAPGRPHAVLGRRLAPSPTTLPDADTPPPERNGFWSGAVIGALASASGVALTATAGWLIVQASSRPAVLTLLVAIVGVRAFGLARPVLRYVERLRSHDAALRLLARRRVEVYDALVPLVPARLGRRRGDLLSSVVDDVDSVVDRELRVRMPVRQYLIVAGIAVLVATALLPAAGLVLLGYVAIAGVAGYGLAASGAARAEASLVALRAELSASVVESVQVADELLMWQATDRMAGRVASISARIGAVSTRAATWLATARATVLTLAGAGMALTAHFGRDAVASGVISAPVAALLVLLPLALADVALPLADAGRLAARTAAAQARLRALERTPPAVRDTVATAEPAGHRIAVAAARSRWVRGGPLTHAVSFRLDPGARVGVVGSSGSGKSTLAAMLMRFLDPDEGRIELGGQSTRDLWLDDVRRLTGLVDDHPHVFGTTLAENVRLARPPATDEEVEDALRRARLGEWLDSLPDGLHTWLGDGHAAVSGGERARIGIARSLLADQPVLVLDEPAAHLDHATATALANEVMGGVRDRSVVWITHTPTGLDLVDEIVDLDVTGTSGTTCGEPVPDG
jgi:ATP-binding cassette subfamily C protein CydCD